MHKTDLGSGLAMSTIKHYYFSLNNCVEPKISATLAVSFNGFHNLRAIYPLLIFSWMLHVVAVKDSISVDSISFPCSLVTDDKILETNVRRWREFTRLAYLFCSLAVLDSRVGHTMDVLSPFIPVSCHSDWLSHGESCPRVDVVHPGLGFTLSFILC